VNDFRDAARKIRRHAADDLETALKAKLDVGMSDTEDAVERNIEAMDAEATGQMKERTTFERFGRQRPTFFYTTAVRVKTDYAKYVDLGTGFRGTSYNAHAYPSPSSTPPIENILEWIIAKNIQPREFNSRYGLAVAIAKAIEITGQRPKPFFREAIFETKPRIESEMEDAGSIAGRRTHRRI